MKYFFNISSFSEYKFDPFIQSSSYLYSASKRAFRSFLDYYSSLRGYNYMNVVLYSIYGGVNLGRRVVEILQNSINSEKSIGMTSGEQILDFTHVTDIASFFIYSLNNLQVLCKINKGEDFHLGTGVGTSIKQLSQLLECKFGLNCNVEWGKLPYRETDIMKAIAPLHLNNPSIKWESKVKIEFGL